MVCEEESPSETAAPSSPSSSPESNFRQLDDAFLQTQTRIWLGEVLQIRLNEQLIISALLADGELLFQVSKVVWKMLLAKHMELRHKKAFKSQPFASKKNSGRYRPYSNVDSFLKICKIVGLTGIDLFTPSDVVERKNTRRVCMCIRSFSKKSRSMNITVPDFDSVTCMVTMSKDLVGYIRRSIELSHSILADSSSYSLQKHAGGKSRQGYSVTRSTGEFEGHSNELDDTEIKHKVLQFDGTDDDLCDYTLEENYNILSPMVEKVFISEDLDNLDIQNQLRNEVSNAEFELLCPKDLLQYHCSENIDHDCKLNWSSSSCSCKDLQIDFSDMTSDLDTRVEQTEESRIMDLDYFEHGVLYPDLFHEENRTPNVHQTACSHGSNSAAQSIEIDTCFEIGDNTEVPHVDGKSFLSREARNLRDQFDAEKNFQNNESFDLHKDKNDQRDKIKEEYESHDIMKCYERACGITSDARFVKEFEETENSLYSPDCHFCKINSPDSAESHCTVISSTQPNKFLEYEDMNSQNDMKGFDDASCNLSDEFLSSQSYSLPKSCKWDPKGKCAMTSSRAKDNKSSSSILEGGSHEETKPCKAVVGLGTAVVELGTDHKELKNAYPALASNALGVDDCEKCPTNDDAASDFCIRDTTTQDIGGMGQRVLHVITNDVVVPTNCDEDVLTNQSPKLECNEHQECEYNMGPMDTVYLSEHTRELRIQEETKPEDENVDSFENLVVTEEGSVEIPKGKPQKKLLIKSLLGGAAAVGLLFTFLLLSRKNGGEKDAQPINVSSHKGKEKIPKYSSLKVKSRSSAEGFYPADKIKLK